MFKKFFLIVILIFLSSSVFATDYNVTVEQLVEMTNTDRNNFISAIKSAKKVNVSTVLDKTIGTLNDVDTSTLTKKAEEVASAILAFCTKLGVGVEKFATSTLGIVVIFILIAKLGIVGSFIASSLLTSLFIFSGIVIIVANTSKVVILKKHSLEKESKKMCLIEEKEVIVPRFSAFIGEQFKEDMGYYRMIATLIAICIMILTVCFS